MLAALKFNKHVRRHIPMHGDWVARAFLVEGGHLRDQPVALLDGVHPGLVHAVLGVPVPIETGRVLPDPLSHCLQVREKLFRKLPLNVEDLPLVEGNHGLLGLGVHTAVMEDHTNAVLGSPGVGVHGVALEGCRGEVRSCPCGGALLGLLTRGGVNLDDIVPRHLGTGLLRDSGGGLVLLALCHSRGLVLINLVIGRVVVVCIAVVGCLSMVVCAVVVVRN